MTTHSDIRKFERLIGSFGNDSKYDRTLAAEGQYQADLQRKEIQDNTSDEVGCILLGTMTRNLDTGEVNFLESEVFKKNREDEKILINNF